MPGKPAARVTDVTGHGGMISGPGIPNVLVGKLPQATLGDMHLCPMVTPVVPPVPHVGGPILMGSTGVFVGKKPAARVGDLCTCVGPPAPTLTGQFTVLIGEVGSGGGSSAGAAASAAISGRAGAQGASPMEISPPEQEEVATEAIEVLFRDSAGNPLAGVAGRITDPVGDEILFYSDSGGRVQSGAYSSGSGYQLDVRLLKEARWGFGEAFIDAPVAMSVEAPGFSDGTPIFFAIVAQLYPAGKQTLEVVSAEVVGERAEVEWCCRPEQMERMFDEFEGELESIFFSASTGISSATSESIPIWSDLSLPVQPENEQTGQESVFVESPRGERIEVKVESGAAELRKVSPGRYRVLA